MKTIIITGPSGSGKTFLSHKISQKFNNTIVIKTDSYYRDNLIIKTLSIFINDIYDRFISLKNKELNKTIESLIKNKKFTTFYYYNFKDKKSGKYIKKTKDNYKKSILIIEGIFAHRLDINYKETINIICNEEIEVCYQRRIKRDIKERGRSKLEVKKRFFNSWNLFFKSLDVFKLNNKIIYVNKTEKNSFEKLINSLNYN